MVLQMFHDRYTLIYYLTLFFYYSEMYISSTEALGFDLGGVLSVLN